MPQALLGLLALAALSMLVLQSSRDRVQDATSTHQLDAVVTARGVGVEVLERLTGYPFDGGEGGTASATGPLAYSPASRFGVSGPSSAGVPLDDAFADTRYDDLDDFHGVDGALAQVQIADPTSGASQTQDFAIAVEVEYVEPDPVTGGWGPVQVADTRTPYKRAIVTVDSPHLAVPLQYARLYVAP